MDIYTLRFISREEKEKVKPDGCETELSKRMGIPKIQVVTKFLHNL